MSVSGSVATIKRMQLVVTAFVLALSGLLVLAPQALAFDGSGTGTVGDPYVITECGELDESGIYVLADDFFAVPGGGSSCLLVYASGVTINGQGNMITCDSGNYNVAIDILSGTSNVTVTNLDIKDCSRAVLTEGANDITLTHLSISNTQAEGIQVQGADGVDISSVTIEDAAGTAMLIYDCDNATVADSVFAAVGAEGLSVQSSSTNVVITGNAFSNVGYNGIAVYDLAGLTVQDNTFEHINEDGMYLEDSAYINITNNTISDIAYSGINLDASSPFTIQDNTITDVGENGINLDGDYDDTLPEIDGDWPTDSSLTNNQITIADGEGYALHIEELSDVTILNNRFQSDRWIEDEDGGNTYDNGTSGNRYYFAGGAGAWTVYDTRDTSGDHWADTGDDVPFSAALSSSTFHGSTAGEAPYDVWGSGYDGDLASLYDDDTETGVAAASEETSATAGLSWEFGQPVNNVSLHVVTEQGERAFTVPTACIYDGTYIDTRAVMDDTTGTITFQCYDFEDTYTSFTGGVVANAGTYYEAWLTYDQLVTPWHGEGQDAHPWTEATASSNTATFSNAENAKTVSLTTPAGTTITCSSVSKENGATVIDPYYNYPVGLVNFCFDTAAADNQVTLVFVTDLKPNQVVARKYNSAAHTYATIPGAAITETTLGGQHALQLVYTIADNGSLDQDPATGSITDPVGLAIAAVGVPNTGLGGRR